MAVDNWLAAAWKLRSNRLLLVANSSWSGTCDHCVLPVHPGRFSIELICACGEEDREG